MEENFPKGPEAVFNLQNTVDHLMTVFEEDPELASALFDKDIETFTQGAWTGAKPDALSPMIIASVGYTSVRLLKLAARLNKNDTIDQTKVIELRERSARLSAAVTAGTVLEVMHENSITSGGQGIYAEGISENAFSPVAAKLNALRMADSLAAQAEHVGLTSVNIPDLLYLGIQTSLVGKRGFSNLMEDKLAKIRAINLSHDDTAMRYDNAATDSFLPENIAKLPELYQTLIAAGQGLNSNYWVPSLMVKNLSISLQFTNPQKSREALMEFGEYLAQPEVRNRLLNVNSSAEEHFPLMTAPNPFEFSANTEVDWTILPPGKLAEKAQSIVSKASKEKEVKIDLERLKALEEIREAWGPDRCYYTTAALRSKIIRIGGQECPDEYILLVLQDLDHENEVMMEHAVAESPIAGPHAMYVYRQDVGEGFSWRDVMAMPKADAKLFNARAVKHMKQGPSMSERAMSLLQCDKAEFMKLRMNRTANFRFTTAVVVLDQSA